MTCCQDHILTENIWFACSETSYSGDERRCYRCGTTNERQTLKMELLSQWKLEAESRKNHPDLPKKYCSSSSNHQIVFITVSCVSSTDRLIQFSISLKALHSVRAFKAVFSELFKCVRKQQILQPAKFLSAMSFCEFLAFSGRRTRFF